MAVASRSQAESIIEFSSHLASVLQKSQNTLPEECPDVLLYTSTLPLPSVEFSKPQKAQLRQHAVSIWNSCNLVSTADDPLDHGGISKLRAFAYLLLASITPPTSTKSRDIPKLFENSLTAIRGCLRAGDFELAGKLLELEADMIPLLEGDNGSRADDQEYVSCAISYFCLRLLHCWKQNRGDLADHHYSHLSNTPHHLEESDVEMVVDLLFEIGRECLSQQDAGNATVWLERAMHMIDTHSTSDNFAGSDLRLNLLHCLVQALSALPGQECVTRANSLLEQLRSEYGARLPILLLSLEVAQPEVDPDIFSAQLQAIIRTAHIIETNHSLIIHYNERLRSMSPLHATRCMKDYILQRLVPESHTDWIEKAIMRYLSIYSAPGLADSSPMVQDLEQELDVFFEAMKHGLSPVAAQAAHALVWKMIQETESGGTRSLAMQWCQLGLHRLFELAGDASIGKLERKIISYHLLVSNTGLAHQMLDQMSFIQKNNKYGRYLAYCAAVRSGNDEEAQSCLNTITNGQGDMDQLLFACIGESVKHSKLLDAACLLQRVVDKHIQSSSPGISLSALLKYTTKSLIEAIGLQSLDHQPNAEVLMRLCTVFKYAVRLQDRQTDASRSSQSTTQLDTVWFEEKSFEIARKHAKTWPPRYIIDLLHYSNKLCYSGGGAPIEVVLSEERRVRQRDSSFMQALLYASEARSVTASYSVEDLPQTLYDSRSKPKISDCRLVLHQKVFRIFTSLREQYQSQTSYLDDEQELMLGQLQTLIPLAFEALLFMNAHTYLGDETAFDEISIKQFLGTSRELKAPVPLYALLADTVLAFASGDANASSQLNGLQIPLVPAARLLGQIIQALRHLQEYSIEQAARWIRCVAQLMVEDIEKVMPNTKIEQSLTMLQSVVQQAMDLAKTSLDIDSPGEIDKESGKAQRYPSEELQWLATKLFNLAVDLFAAGDRRLARQWTSYAVDIAGIDADLGLVDILRGKAEDLFNNM